jgi:hypothetical protein
MGLQVGSAHSGNIDDFQKFALSRFAYKHLFVVESKVEGASLPSLFVSRGTFPFNEIQAYPVERNNSNIYYPELVDCSQLEIEFYESMDNAVSDFFETWSNMILNKTDKGDVVFNIPSKFKKDIYMFRLDTMPKGDSNEFARVFGYVYEDCFPIRITDYPLDMADPGVVSLGITFSCDNVRRLSSGHGITSPKILDRGAIRMDTSPLNIEQKPQPATQLVSDNPIQGKNIDQQIKQQEMVSDNPIQGKMNETESRDTQLKKAEALWLEKETNFRSAAADTQVRASAARAEGYGLWVSALLKAAAETGINIGIREAAYMAYAAAKKVGAEGIFGGGVGKVVTETKKNIPGAVEPQ